MKHNFSLTFRVGDRHELDVQQVANQMTGSDFQIERESLTGTEFSVHFQREGGHSTELLEYAREQVLKVVPNAEVVSVDMSEAPTPMSMVDDITKIVIRAVQIFHEPELAHAWLNKPQAALNGAIPKALMVSPRGRTDVAKVLAGLEVVEP